MRIGGHIETNPHILVFGQLGQFDRIRAEIRPALLLSVYLLLSPHQGADSPPLQFQQMVTQIALYCGLNLLCFPLLGLSGCGDRLRRRQASQYQGQRKAVVVKWSGQGDSYGKADWHYVIRTAVSSLYRRVAEILESGARPASAP
jgi:hypothetical protein